MDMARTRVPVNYYVPVLIISLIIIGVIAALLVGGSEKPKSQAKTPTEVADTECGPYRKDGIVTINGHRINVEIAYDDKAKTKGLSGRPCIGSNWGMLFDFSQDGQYAIWMKDMKFPIDVIWISSEHNVSAVEVNFTPSSYPEKRANQQPARYVLELKANQSKEFDINLGTLVHFQKV
jgi:uncharacterized membrane protein (UPF0127 family)